MTRIDQRRDYGSGICRNRPRLPQHGPQNALMILSPRHDGTDPQRPLSGTEAAWVVSELCPYAAVTLECHLMRQKYNGR